MARSKKDLSILDSLTMQQKIAAAAVVFLLLLVSLPFMVKKTIPVFNRVMGLPSLSILEDYQPIGSIEIYDYQDNFVGVLQGQEDRQVVKLNQISDYMKRAILAAEDSDFYRHSGFSFTGFIRAIAKNIKAGKLVQGGSTITQQMVKNLFIKEDERYKRTLRRKIIELLIAIEVEQKYDKDKILEIYLNQVYFGNRAYGIERAAQRYFSKPASKLDLVESSFLAGLLTAPSYLAKNKDKAFERQKYVLLRMQENGYITAKEYEEAIKAELKFKKSEGNFSKFPYYFSLVEHELKKRFNRSELMQTGLKVYTGLDPVAQRLAKRSLNIGVKNAAAGINQGALVSIDVETAQVRALVGGVGDFWKYQYNRATNVHTLGSAIKPFVYLTAFMKGVIDPDSIILDEELELEDLSTESMVWAPKNFDDEFHGPITARAALIFSRNIPAIKVGMKTGIKDIIETAEKAGFKSEMRPLLSLALGAQAFSPLEVAGAYSTLARGGTQIDPILIRKITDSKSRVLEINRPTPKQALPERYVGMVVDILRDVVRYGTGALANIPDKVIAGKTGTADGSRDIWFVGFTADTVSVVWAGNENNKEVASRYATGGSTPAWIWKEFMSNFYKEKPRPTRGFSFTNNYIEVMVDPLTGLLATEYTPNPVKKRYAPGTQPKRYAPTPRGIKAVSRKEKSRSSFLDLGRNKLSEEDEKIRTIKKDKRYKKEKYADDRRKAIDDDEESAKIEIIPMPKFFKIEKEDKEEIKPEAVEQL